MPISVSEVLTRVAIVLQDEEHVRWTEEELILWLNDAASEIVIRRPAARAITEDLTLEEGPFQELPEGAVQLLDVVRNIPGRSISRVMRRLLDDQFSDWYVLSPAKTKAIKHYTLDDDTPTQFYVYPPAKAGLKVEVKYSCVPPKVASPTDMLDLDRAYIGPLVSYVLYRSHAKDSEYANGAVAVAHFQAFNEALGTQNAVSAAETQKAGTE